MNQAGEGMDELEAEVGELRERLSVLESKLKGTFRGGRTPGQCVEVLLVTIGALEAAFELEAVEEVVPAASLHPVPEAPNWLLGTLNLRGRTTPVVHIGARLHGESAELSIEDLFVITHVEGVRVGFVVSQVGRIIDARLDEQVSLKDTPHANYVVGTFSHEGQTRLLLGVAELLRRQEVRSFSEAGKG